MESVTRDPSSAGGTGYENSSSSLPRDSAAEDDSVMDEFPAADSSDVVPHPIMPPTKITASIIDIIFFIVCDLHKDSSFFLESLTQSGVPKLHTPPLMHSFARKELVTDAYEYTACILLQL